MVVVIDAGVRELKLMLGTADPAAQLNLGACGQKAHVVRVGLETAVELLVRLGAPEDHATHVVPLAYASTPPSWTPMRINEETTSKHRKWDASGEAKPVCHYLSSCGPELSHINAAAPGSLHFSLNTRFSVQPITMQPLYQLTERPPVVVIVDDDPAVCGSLKFSLELEGFAVRAYAGAIELLHVGDLGVCDCFVIDQRMPGMSGMELIAKLRDREVVTPAILLISDPNPALSARAIAAGIPIVEKPLLGNALVDKIREACQRSDGQAARR